MNVEAAFASWFYTAFVGVTVPTVSVAVTAVDVEVSAVRMAMAGCTVVVLMRLLAAGVRMADTKGRSAVTC